MFSRLKEDIRCIKDRDPAARSTLEILFLYPGFRAVRMYRRAHWCFVHHLFFFARLISQRCVHKTNIEIHPGAQIGRRFFIDHGTGVVIGETAVIGDDCILYQGVTLGGTGKDTGKRHPTLGNNVLVGAGAKVLGPLIIGDNSNVAAGSIVLSDIPANCTAVGIPAKIVKQDGIRIDRLDQIHVADPVELAISGLLGRMDQLEEELADATNACPRLRKTDEEKELWNTQNFWVI